MPTSLSVSPLAAELLAGPPQTGVGLGHGYALFGDQVLAITPPGALRMPNGIESDLVVASGEQAVVGDGELRTERGSITGGPLWDPRPRTRVSLSLVLRPRFRLEELAGRGPGLTPLGDDILIGYLGALALAGAPGRMTHVAERVGRRTTALSRTLLRLAACALLPEAAHMLLVEADIGPLLRFGATSGKGIAVGLALAGTAEAQGRPVEIISSIDLLGVEFLLGISACRSGMQKPDKLVVGHS
jgi:hypothetical protein